jgi:PAX-interacting protein 1
MFRLQYSCPFSICNKFICSFYPQNKTLKDQYLVGLSDLYEISTKLHANSDMASQKPTDQDEQMKSFKLILDCSLHHLQIGKGSLQPVLDESIPMYKSQITSILNSRTCKYHGSFF